MKKKVSNLIITNEHGAWAVLFIPMLTGVLAVKKMSVELVPLSLLILFSFLLFKPAEILVNEIKNRRGNSEKFQSALTSIFVYGTVALLLLVYEVYFRERLLLLGFAVGAAGIFSLIGMVERLGKKGMMRQFLGILLLTSTAPITIYCLEGKVFDYPISLWFYNLLFFLSGAIIVNFLIDKLALVKKKNDEHPLLSVKDILFVYHFALTLFCVAVIFFFPSDFLKAVAFLPIIVHAFIIYFSGKVETNFKKVGIMLLLHSVVFASLISA